MTAEEINAYIRRITPSGGYRTRLRRYHAAKNRLLPQIPKEQHDAVIRQLCQRLRI